MTNTNRVLRLTLVAAASFVVLFAAEKFSDPNAYVTTAAARMGRPMTPMSYAGAARRTVRQNPYVAGAARWGPYVADAAARRDPYVAGTTSAGVTPPAVIRNPYVAGAPKGYAGVAQQTARRGPYIVYAPGVEAAGVHSGCKQTTDEYGNVYTQC
jgi:hypothetical protein